MNEENVSVKISMPLIDDIELQRIDTFYDDIVSEYTKAFVKEKEQVIVQRLMMNLQQENARLKDKIEKVIEYVNHYETIRGYYEYEECGYDEYNYEEDLKEELLELLKEN